MVKKDKIPVRKLHYREQLRFRIIDSVKLKVSSVGKARTFNIQDRVHITRAVDIISAAILRIHGPWACEKFLPALPFA